MGVDFLKQSLTRLGFATSWRKLRVVFPQANEPPDPVGIVEESRPPAKSGVLHARVAQVVEEPDAVESQHGGQRVGMGPLPALRWTGQMRSSNICQGIESSIRSKKSSSRRVLRFLPGAACLALPAWRCLSVKSLPW